jgi:hypothetical protein
MLPISKRRINIFQGFIDILLIALLPFTFRDQAGPFDTPELWTTSDFNKAMRRACWRHFQECLISGWLVIFRIDTHHPDFAHMRRRISTHGSFVWPQPLHVYTREMDAANALNMIYSPHPGVRMWTASCQVAPLQQLWFTFGQPLEITANSSHAIVQQPPLRMYRNISPRHATHNYSTMPGVLPAFNRGYSVRATANRPLHPLLERMLTAKATYGTWLANRFLLACVHNTVGLFVQTILPMTCTIELALALTLPH